MTAPAALAAHERGIEAEQELVAEIDALRQRERVAVEEAVGKDPTKSAYTPNSAADRLRRKRESLERRLADLREFELPARASVALAAQEAQKSEAVERAYAEARRFDPLEREALARAAEAYAAFVGAWSDLVSVAYQREQLADRLVSEGVAPGSPEDLVTFNRPFRSTLSPFPADPEVFFNAATVAVTDPHAADGAVVHRNVDGGVMATVDYFAQRHPDAAPFVEALASVREQGLFRRVSELRFSPLRYGLHAPELP